LGGSDLILQFGEAREREREREKGERSDKYLRILLLVSRVTAKLQLVKGDLVGRLKMNNTQLRTGKRERKIEEVTQHSQRKNKEKGRRTRTTTRITKTTLIENEKKKREKSASKDKKRPLKRWVNCVNLAEFLLQFY